MRRRSASVLLFLRTRTGRDFSYYKRATIVRRISRRMQINGVERMPEYADFLRTHQGEAGALLQDLLISVTNFFRDRESFEALEARIPEIMSGKKAGDVVRVWVAACATGEEAYSIAMLLTEYAGQMESAADDPGFCHRSGGRSHRGGTGGDLPARHRRRCFRGAPAAFFREGPTRLPGAAGAAGMRALCRARPAQGFALFPHGPCLLPQSAHLPQP